MFKTALKIYALIVLFGFAVQFGMPAMIADAKGGGGASFSSGRSFSSPSFSSPRPSFSPAPRPSFSPAPAKPSFSPAPKPATPPPPQVTGKTTVIHQRTTVVQPTPVGGGFFSNMLAVAAGLWLFQSCNNQKQSPASEKG